MNCFTELATGSFSFVGERSRRNEAYRLDLRLRPLGSVRRRAYLRLLTVGFLTDTVLNGTHSLPWQEPRWPFRAGLQPLLGARVQKALTSTRANAKHPFRRTLPGQTKAFQ